VVRALIRDHISPNATEQDVDDILAFLAISSKISAGKKGAKQQLMVTIAASPVVKAMAISFSKAPARSAEKQQLLSSISAFFSVRGLNDLVIKVHCPPDTPAVSRFIKRSADEHALQNGPGRVAKERNKIIRNRADSADVDFLLSIIFRHIHMHAYGLV
jgi:hypothetical protein